ncbi:MAG: ribosome biogenesis GTPase Der [Candidatus Xenobia bacterium]
MKKPAPGQPIAGTLDRPVGVVAIVGRPNVGKSSLFNRLLGTRHSIVEAEPGVTRDRVYGECEWNGRTFTLVDTGGMVPQEQRGMLKHILQQAQRAIAEADVVLFVVDVTAGIHPDDEDVARLLRGTSKPVRLLCNKVDTIQREPLMAEFYALGLGDPWPVSAVHGLGTGELLDEVLRLLPPPPEEAPADRDVWDPDKDVSLEWEGAIRVAIVGRPNVGKSSMTNLIVGDQRSIVDDVPGTTRDSLDTPLLIGEQRYIIIDTAGLRRPSRVKESVEYFSTVRAAKAIDRCDVALMVLDAVDGIAAQDQRVAGLVQEASKATIVIVNKWDLVKRGSKKAWIEKIRGEFDFLSWAPVLFTSTLTGTGAEQIFPTIDKVWAEFTKRIDTPVLNRLLQDAMLHRPPPTYKGQQLKLFYAYEEKVRPPTFVLRVNNVKLLHFSYKRYLENHLRAAFGFTGTPIRIELRKK